MLPFMKKETCLLQGFPIRRSGKEKTDPRLCFPTKRRRQTNSKLWFLQELEEGEEDKLPPEEEEKVEDKLTHDGATLQEKEEEEEEEDKITSYCASLHVEEEEDQLTPYSASLQVLANSYCASLKE